MTLFTDPHLDPPPAEPPPIDIPPAEPPPIDPLSCPPGCLLEHLTNGGTHTPISTDLVNIDWDHPETKTTPPALAPDCVTHVVCTPRVCGLHAGDKSSITICRVNTSNNRMVNGGSNVCVTGDLSSLVDVVDIDPIPILVALEGSSSSYNNCLTKRGFLPLSLSNGTSYFQMCYYCANLVETIISPAAVLSSSDVFFSWTQEGFRDPSIPGSLCFTSQDGLRLMQFPLHCRDGLYYCETDVYTVDCDPV